jgi:hypothetical protein
MEEPSIQEKKSFSDKRETRRFSNEGKSMVTDWSFFFNY